MDQSRNGEKLESLTTRQRFVAGLAEVWIGAILAAFVLIRILGSHTFRHLVHRFMDL